MRKPRSSVPFQQCLRVHCKLLSWLNLHRRNPLRRQLQLRHRLRNIRQKSVVTARRRRQKPETETTETRPATTGTPGAGAAPATVPPPPASTTTLIGQLSADDSTATPTEAAQTKRLIDSTEVQLKKLSTQQQAAHKDAVAQVNSFLMQARQALSTNDVVGAQTLANKAKILIDELLK